MKFNSQICTTREQSERLITLGLKKETADMAHAQSIVLPRYKVLQVNYWHLLSEYEERTFFPAWSLHRLLEMTLNSTDTKFKVRFNQLDVKYAYELLLAHIEWLIKEGHFNKEYLEEKK